MLLATGITTMLVLQALLNMAVIVAPRRRPGVTLPFVSYGGSSLVVSLLPSAFC
jgi:cell division protein FtsW